MEIIKENTKRLRWQTQHNTKGVKETEREKAIIYCLGNSTRRKNSPELRKTLNLNIERTCEFPIKKKKKTLTKRETETDRDRHYPRHIREKLMTF